MSILNWHTSDILSGILSGIFQQTFGHSIWNGTRVPRSMRAQTELKLPKVLRRLRAQTKLQLRSVRAQTELEVFRSVLLPFVFRSMPRRSLSSL